MNARDPVYPLDELNQTLQTPAAQHFGLCARDHVAIEAMKGILAAGRTWPDELERRAIARSAFAMADELIRVSQIAPDMLWAVPQPSTSAQRQTPPAP